MDIKKETYFQNKNTDLNFNRTKLRNLSISISTPLSRFDRLVKHYHSNKYYNNNNINNTSSSNHLTNFYSQREKYSRSISSSYIPLSFNEKVKVLNEINNNTSEHLHKYNNYFTQIKNSLTEINRNLTSSSTHLNTNYTIATTSIDSKYIDNIDKGMIVLYSKYKNNTTNKNLSANCNLNFNDTDVYYKEEGDNESIQEKKNEMLKIPMSISSKNLFRNNKGGRVVKIHNVKNEGNNLDGFNTNNDDCVIQSKERKYIGRNNQFLDEHKRKEGTLNHKIITKYSVYDSVTDEDCKICQCFVQ